MKKLEISLLGPVAVHYDGQEIKDFASRKALALLVYLAGQDRPVPRDFLTNLLWPQHEESRGLANLSVALSSLRKHFGEFISADRHTIGLIDQEGLHIDAQRFARKSQEILAQKGELKRRAAEELAAVLALYRGDFLEGFKLRDALEFETWALTEQERLRGLALEAGGLLSDYYQERGQYAEGLALSQRLLSMDPLDEAMHRQLMRLWALAGQMPQALAQYESCRQQLAAELGVVPDEETTALYEAIRQEQFPAPTAAPAAAVHNIPAALTPLIGREQELAQIERWIRQPAARLLTILGPGGIGKTRLAQAALRQHIGRFLDGVWYVSLVAVTEGAAIPFQIADTLNLTLPGGLAPAAALAQALADKELLLLLDNFEQLVDGTSSALVDELLAAAPELKLIITTRERLNARAEQLLLLDGLAAAGTATQLGPAGQLFWTRLQQNRPEIELDEATTGQIITLCEQLGGHPLALELAAAWGQALPLADIIAEVSRDQRFLASPGAGRADRHQSITAVFATSWQRLEPEAQRVYRQLSVFRGGFTLAAARAVTNSSALLLAELVNRALLRLDSDDRYRRHPLLLQYAADRLTESGTEQLMAEGRHLNYFVDLVTAQDERWPTAAAEQAIALMDRDWANIRTALLRAATAGWYDEVEMLWRSVESFFWHTGRYLEADQLFSTCLRAVEQRPASQEQERILVVVKGSLGEMWQKLGYYQNAYDLLVSILPGTAQHGLAQKQINVLQRLCEISEELGKREEAFDYVARALALVEALGDETRTIVIKNSQGNLYTRYGRYDEAEAIFLDCLDIARRTGSEFRTAVVCGNLGITTKRLRRFQEALRWYEEAEKLFHRLGHNEGHANALLNKAMVLDELSDYQAALEIKQQVIDVYRQVGYRSGEAAAYSSMGVSYMRLGQLDEAERIIRQGLALQHELDMRWLAVSTIRTLGDLAIHQGNLAQAI
ncbi:MAG: tetratricopeptide repeat protein, partial [Anaerolineales bacterium]|nr:tetratricopeptide repeat protein [Anaerolineales bacterium]